MSKRKGKKERSVTAPRPAVKAQALQDWPGWTWPVAAAVLLAATFLAYWPVVHGGFVFDDEVIVIGNKCVTASDGLYRIWFTAENFDYLPITYSGFWLEYRLWEQKPLGYHLVSLGLHAVIVILLWLLLGRLGIAGAWWGALIFAVHPVAVSSVAWISEQKNLCGLLFALTSLLLYLKFETSGHRSWYALSVAAFVAALLGKASVVMMPFLLLLYRWRRAGKLRLADLAWTAPFFLASLVLGLVTIWFQVHRAIAGETVPIGNYLERVYAAGYIVWFYIGKDLVPTHLSMIYPQWDYAQLQLWPTAALIAFLAVLWRLRRSGRWGQACWMGFGAFVLILTPVLGFVPMSFMRFALVADHFQYPALPALAAIAGALAVGVIESCRSRISANLSRSIAAACCLGIVVLAALTWRQAGAYKDSVTLWSDSVANNLNSSMAHYNLGVSLAKNGQDDEASDHYRKALEIDPDNVDAHLNLGVDLANRGQVGEAIDHYRKALEIKPDSAGLHNNLGNALIRRGKFDEAISHCRRAVEIKPDYADAHDNLGSALAGYGQVDDAIAHYRKALELKPGSAGAHFNLGNALIRRGQVDEAISHYRRALEIKPSYFEARDNLEHALANRGQVDEDIDHYRKALEIKPDSAEAHVNLGVALERGQIDEAITHFRKALEINPDYVAAHVDLGAALARRGQVDEAIAHYQKALQIKPDHVTAHVNLGVVLAGQKRFDEAIAHYLKVLEIRPDLLAAHYNLGLAMAGCGRFNEAREHYQKALDLALARNDAGQAESIRAQIKLASKGN
jgi:protein O-mannosyl-transferase